MTKDKVPLAVDPLDKVTLDEPEKFTYIGSLMSNEEREQLRLMRLNNVNVFGWSHSDMIEINPTVASHMLNIIPKARLVRQKVRSFHQDCHQIIQTKVDNLLRAGFIREVKYPEWLANVVVVPKKGGKWRGYGMKLNPLKCAFGVSSGKFLGFMVT